MPSSSSFRNRARSLTVGHPPWNELTFCGLGARGGGPDGPQRTFCELLWRTDLRIAAPKSPKSPRMRQTLAVQARNPKRPRRAPPPILDETALGRSGEESALHGACRRFRFALAVPIQTPCSIATSPRSSQATPAGLHALVALTPRLRPRPPMRPRPSNPRALRMSSGSMASG